jgi:hypothetical protein
MSRALGAAFLSHQVEQLEKSVEARGTTSNNWRDREAGHVGGRGSRRGAPHGQTSRGGGRKKDRKDTGRREGEIVKPIEPSKPTKIVNKDAEVIVVDSSVLIHALGHVKKWCQDGREEIVIIPLEGMYVNS